MKTNCRESVASSPGETLRCVRSLERGNDSVSADILLVLIGIYAKVHQKSGNKRKIGHQTYGGL